MNPFDHLDSHHGTEMNPATGLPMISGDMTGVDIGGSAWGFASPHEPFAVEDSDDWRSPWD